MAIKTEAVATGTDCSAEEGGLAACWGTYVVFCDERELLALDCSLFIDALDNETATCGEMHGEIDCGWSD